MALTLEEMEKKLSSMEKRLQDMEDIEAIKQLHIHNMNTHTWVETEAEIACFADNGVLDIGDNEPFRGKEAIAKILGQIGSIERPKHEQNPTKGAFIVHPLITVNGDKATGKWIQYELEADPETHKSHSWFQSIYDTEYIKENGEWKISYLKWRPNLPKMDMNHMLPPK